MLCFICHPVHTGRPPGKRTGSSLGLSCVCLSCHLTICFLSADPLRLWLCGWPPSWFPGHFLVSFLISLWSSQTGSGKGSLKGLSSRVHQPRSPSSVCSSLGGLRQGPRIPALNQSAHQIRRPHTVLTEQPSCKPAWEGHGQALWPFWSAQHMYGASVLRTERAYLLGTPDPESRGCSTIEALQMDQERQTFHCN